MVEQINPSFKGYHKYDWLRHRKIQTTKKFSKYIFRTLNFLLMLIFISANFASYFYLKEKFAMSGMVLNGFILTFSTGFYNFFYSRILNLVIELENHKYLHS
jgi:hypothetical protein